MRKKVVVQGDLAIETFVNLRFAGRFESAVDGINKRKVLLKIKLTYRKEANSNKIMRCTNSKLISTGNKGESL